MSRTPRRVLHVVGAMNRGGVETWLMHVLREIDSRRIQMDFLVHTASQCTFDREIESHGSRIIRCLDSWRSASYSKSLRSLLLDVARYDVIHSHVHHFSGMVLRIASQAGIPTRIAHSHSDTSSVDSYAGWFRRAYLQLMKRWVWKHATDLLAVSDGAASSLLGDGWHGDRRVRIFYCGIDLRPFRSCWSQPSAREALGIGEHDFVIGHVGRFDTPKNHRFLLQVAAEVMAREPNSRLLLIGDGPLRAELLTELRSLSIDDRTILTGLRDDVYNLLPAIDVFVFPSLYEGLPLTLLEAQAAALPCIVSDVITREVDLVPGLIRRLRLADGAQVWASAVLDARPQYEPRRADALALLEHSDFNIRRSVDELSAIYGACLPHHHAS